MSRTPLVIMSSLCTGLGGYPVPCIAVMYRTRGVPCIMQHSHDHFVKLAHNCSLAHLCSLAGWMQMHTSLLGCLEVDKLLSVYKLSWRMLCCWWGAAIALNMQATANVCLPRYVMSLLTMLPPCTQAICHAQSIHGTRHPCMASMHVQLANQ